jgi:hypothetical protein
MPFQKVIMIVRAAWRVSADVVDRLSGDMSRRSQKNSERSAGELV